MQDLSGEFDSLIVHMTTKTKMNPLAVLILVGAIAVGGFAIFGDDAFNMEYKPKHPHSDVKDDGTRKVRYTVESQRQEFNTTLIMWGPYGGQDYLTGTRWTKEEIHNKGDIVSLDVFSGVNVKKLTMSIKVDGLTVCIKTLSGKVHKRCTYTLR